MWDTEKLIAEIEKRNPLYNIKSKKYSNRELKMKLWDEVCAALIENWEILPATEKTIKSKLVQTKWKSVRDQFKREVTVMNHSKSGQAAKKKKKYLYFDQLLFLTPSLEMRPTTSNIRSPDDSGEENVDDENEGESTQEVEESQPHRAPTLPEAEDSQLPSTFVASQRSQTLPTTSNRVKSKGTKKTTEEVTEIRAITKVLNESVALQREVHSQPRDESGNRAFLMSLLPLMEQMSIPDMFSCRLRLMQVLQECRFPSQQSSQDNAAYPPARHRYNASTRSNDCQVYQSPTWDIPTSSASADSQDIQYGGGQYFERL